MVRLSLGTALMVATVLTIPDTIAIIPSTHDATALLIRVAGLWLTVFIQWSLAFLGILHVAALVNRGVVVSPQGISLSRLSKPIEWSSIAGVGGESRPFISKLMFLKQPAMRLQIYVQNKKEIKVKNIDSLFFSQEEFASLTYALCQSSFGFAPDAAQVVIANQEEEKIKAAYRKSNTKSKLITAYIAIMLIAFTGRGAARNYFYNQAGQFVNQANYETGKRFCELSLSIDGTYPYALDRLARCEFRLKDSVNAEKHWEKALRMKPDLVSAKVGLSNIHIQRKEFDEAKKLLVNALRLEPRDIPVLLNLGYLNMQSGNAVEGLKYFERALALAPESSTVRLLAAQAYFTAGSPNKAQDLLTGLTLNDIENHNKHIFTKLKADLVAQRGAAHE
jgi:tetratricopeptide (TPR) repeat protein